MSVKTKALTSSTVPRRLLGTLAPLAALVLSACVTAPPAKIDVSAQLPKKWRAPVHAAKAKKSKTANQYFAHNGKVSQLLDWWRTWNDPLLVDLISAAQQQSPTVASAAARIAQARYGVTARTSAMLPNIGGSANVTRKPMQQPPLPKTIVHNHVAGAQLQWEIDLFGGLNQARRAAKARLKAAQAQWHEARVSLAADVANQYFSLRACQRGLEILAADARSQAEISKLTAKLESAGFAAPATLALAQAGTAQAQAQHNELRAKCSAAIKGLTTLTAIDEDELRKRLEHVSYIQSPPLVVDEVPAQVLAQRPDVYAAAQALAAASGDVGYAKAQRLPHLTFSGSIARSLITSNFAPLDNKRNTVWSVGPIGLSMPLFDGGRSAAQVHSSKAQYEAAVLQYKTALRNAVRDVETALVNLHSAKERSLYMEKAVRGFQKSFAAENAKYKAGMGSMLELESARRNLNKALLGQSKLQQQTQASWVALYRALGGGWRAKNNETRADYDLIQKGKQMRKKNANARKPVKKKNPTSSNSNIVQP